MKKLVLKITGFLCLVVLLTSTAFAQSRTITGTVIDSESQPVIGAVVNEMGTSNGTVTVSDGSFSITSSRITFYWFDIFKATILNMQNQGKEMFYP